MKFHITFMDNKTSSALFSKELGAIHPFTASLHVKPDATPRFFKPHPVPFAIKDAISQELK